MDHGKRVKRETVEAPGRPRVLPQVQPTDPEEAPIPVEIPERVTAPVEQPAEVG